MLHDELTEMIADGMRPPVDVSYTLAQLPQPCKTCTTARCAARPSSSSGVAGELAQRALVIGGASGIGLATVRALRFAGLRDRRCRRERRWCPEGGRRTRRRREHSGAGRDRRGFRAHGVGASAPLDAVVNCAGLSIPGALTELDLSGWRTTIDVCPTGTFLVLKTRWARAVRRWGDRLPFVAQRAPTRRRDGVLLCREGRGDDAGGGRGLELAERGIRVNAVGPDSSTPLLTEASASSPACATSTSRHPVGSRGTPGDIAGLITYLLSDGASWITGSAIDINGGAHTQRCRRARQSARPDGGLRAVGSARTRPRSRPRRPSSVFVVLWFGDSDGGRVSSRCQRVGLAWFQSGSKVSETSRHPNICAIV